MIPKQIRWTQEHAASEFAINPRTLSARIKQLGILAGEDNRYSTKDIATAVFGDLEREKIRLTSAEADAQERENRVTEGQLVEVEELKRVVGPIHVELIRIIESSGLRDSEKDSIRSKIAELYNAPRNQ